MNTIPTDRLMKTKGIPLLLIFLLCLGGCAGMSKPGEEIFAEKAFENRAEVTPAPQNPEPDYVILAQELIRQGFYKVALVQLEQAAAGGAETPEVFYLMGVCHREEDHNGPAEENFHKALSLDPDFAPAFNGLGLLYRASGRPDKARTCFEKAVGLNPARADFNNNLGVSQMKAKEYAGAAARFREALALAPDFKISANNLALCLGLSGRNDEALLCLENNFPRAVAFNNMGAIFQIKGEKEKASGMFKAALELEPGLEEARRNLARIQGEQ